MNAGDNPKTFTDKAGNRWKDVDACILCEKQDSTPLFKIPAKYSPFPTDLSRSLKCCRSCDLRWVTPQVTSILEQNQVIQPLSSPEEPGLDLRFYRGVVDRLEGCSPRGKLLDVGCGSGLLLDQLQRRGWEAVGVEPSEERSRHAREKLGLQVFTGYLEDIAFPDQEFDVVSMTEVLEHLTQPKKLLHEIRRVLRNDGLLVVTTPNPQCIEAVALRSRWVMVHVATHFNFYSRQALSRLLGETGFQMVHRFTWIKGKNPFKNMVKYALGTAGLSLANSHIVIAKKGEIMPSMP